MVGIAWFKFLYSIIRKFKGRTDRFCSSRQTVPRVSGVLERDAGESCRLLRVFCGAARCSVCCNNQTRVADYGEKAFTSHPYIYKQPRYSGTRDRCVKVLFIRVLENHVFRGTVL